MAADSALDIHHCRPLLNQFRTVIACTVEDDMHFLRYRVRFPDGYEEPADIKTVDGVIFPDNRTADVIQVQGPHDVQTGTTTCGFHYMGFLPGRHPAISQFCSLFRVKTR